MPTSPTADWFRIAWANRDGSRGRRPSRSSPIRPPGRSGGSCVTGTRRCRPRGVTSPSSRWSRRRITEAVRFRRGDGPEPTAWNGGVRTRSFRCCDDTVEIDGSARGARLADRRREFGPARGALTQTVNLTLCNGQSNFLRSIVPDVVSLISPPPLARGNERLGRGCMAHRRLTVQQCDRLGTKLVPGERDNLSCYSCRSSPSPLPQLIRGWIK